MKNRTWILIFSVFALLLIGAMIIIFHSNQASSIAKVYSDGRLILSIDLRKDSEYKVVNGNEWNTLCVHGGKICVTDSSCASRDCVRRGASDGGAPIVCLPNRMVIEFAQEEYDAMLQ